MAPVHAEWGLHGVEVARERSAVPVIVDVLSFSTAVDVAAARGARVLPFPLGDMEAARLAADRAEAILALPRRAAAGGFSLSPASLLVIPEGTKLMLPSPNGSRLSFACGDTPALAGCLRNAAAVAAAASRIAGEQPICVIPAGERWPDGSLRPCIEDLLGAGAVIHHLGRPCSPEAWVARDAFRSAQNELADLIRASVSGRELADAGFADDVEMAVQLNVSPCAPVLIDGGYRAA